MSKQKDQLKVLSIKLPEKDIDRLRDHAKKQFRSTSAEVRRLVNEELARAESKP